MANSPTELVPCRWCGGDGQVQVDGEAWAQCHFCDGEGKGRRCPTCGGSGDDPIERHETRFFGSIPARCAACAGSGIDQAEEEPAPPVVVFPWLTSITVEREHLEAFARDANGVWDDLTIRATGGKQGLFLPVETVIALRRATNAALGIPACAACGMVNGAHSVLCERKR